MSPRQSGAPAPDPTGVICECGHDALSHHGTDSEQGCYGNSLADLCYCPHTCPEVIFKPDHFHLTGIGMICSCGGVWPCAENPDWMIQCDSCGLRVPALERYRGSGDAGLREIRSMLAALGWTHDSRDDLDQCASCNLGAIA